MVIIIWEEVARMMASENNWFVALNDHKIENSNASDERRRRRNTWEDRICKKKVFLAEKKNSVFLCFLWVGLSDGGTKWRDKKRESGKDHQLVLSPSRTFPLYKFSHHGFIQSVSGLTVLFNISSYLCVLWSFLLASILSTSNTIPTFIVGQLTT